MANDALEPSLSEHESSLERQVKDLQAILAHLLACINEAKADVAGNRARIDRCAALAASAAARAELANQKASEAVPVAREAALEELLKVARAANDEDDPPRHAGDRRRRDRHGMHLVRDAAGGTAALAALFSFLRSPLARGTHRAVTLAMAGALGAAGTVAGPSLLMPSPSPAPAAAVPAHRHHQVPRRASMLNLDPPPGRPVQHAHRRHQAAASPAPSPAASGAVPPGASPQPSPQPTLPVPVPSPSPTVTVPVPLPTCHGKHCHGGGPGEVLSRLLAPVAALTP